MSYILMVTDLLRITMVSNNHIHFPICLHLYFSLIFYMISFTQFTQKKKCILYSSTRTRLSISNRPIGARKEELV